MNTNKILKSVYQGRSVYLVQAIFQPGAMSHYLEAKKVVVFGYRESVKACCSELVQNRMQDFYVKDEFFPYEIPDEMIGFRVSGGKSLRYKNLDNNLCLGIVISRDEGSIFHAYPENDNVNIYKKIQEFSPIPLLDEWQNPIMDYLQEEYRGIFDVYYAGGCEHSKYLYINDNMIDEDLISEVIKNNSDRLYKITEYVLQKTA